MSDESTNRLLRRAIGARRDAPQGTCLDAETLAAWSDGSLQPSERATAEAHAADCDRCLAILATVARTMPVVPAVPWWRRQFTLRWMVPLAATVTALSLWVLVERPHELQRTTLSTAARADAPRQAAVEKPDTGRVAPAPAPQESRAHSAPAAGARVRDAAVTKEERIASTENMTAKAGTAAAAAKPESGGLAERVQPLAPPQAAPAAPSSARSDMRARFPMSAALLQDSTLLILSPDAAVRWRIRGGSVERSIDGGVTWETQPTGTSVTLVAGSSPSPEICWIAGRAGTVLRTTDGRTWQRLAFPTTTDLIAVTASDASTATVTGADGRVYRTTDGGLTWIPQEIFGPPANLY